MQIFLFLFICLLKNIFNEEEDVLILDFKPIIEKINENSIGSDASKNIIDSTKILMNEYPFINILKDPPKIDGKDYFEKVDIMKELDELQSNIEHSQMNLYEYYQRYHKIISHTNDGRANKNSNSTESNTDSVADSKPEKVYINVSKQQSTEVSDVKQSELPKSSEPKEVMPTNVVKFEKPVRKSVNSRLNNSSKPTPTVVRTIKYTDDKKIDHSSSAYVTLNSLEQKMNSFRIRLPIYMCALHISTDNVIADTDITYYRDIRDGKTDIKLYEYIVLSEYLMKKYNACTNSEAKSTFKQIAAVFNDIYVQTLYFNDVDTANAGK
jgi:hypothetical protein